MAEKTSRSENRDPKSLDNAAMVHAISVLIKERLGAEGPVALARVFPTMSASTRQRFADNKIKVDWEHVRVVAVTLGVDVLVLVDKAEGFFDDWRSGALVPVLPFRDAATGELVYPEGQEPVTRGDTRRGRMGRSEEPTTSEDSQVSQVANWVKQTEQTMQDGTSIPSQTTAARDDLAKARSNKRGA